MKYQIIIKRSVLLLLLLLSVPALAQTITLKDAIHFSIENNTQLQMFFLDKKVRVHELRILKQKFSPQMFFNMGLTIQNLDYFNEDFDEKKLHSYPSLKMLTPVGTEIEISADQNVGYEKNQSRAGQALHVVIEQPLLKGRNIQVNKWSIENAMMMETIEGLLYEKAIERVIYGVIMQYHVTQLAKENVEFQNRWVAQSERFYENLSVKVNAGRAPLSDLTSSEFEIKQARNYLAQAKLNYRQEIRQLAEMMGLNHESFEISPLALDPHLQTTLDQENFINQTLANDIEHQVYLINKERLKKQLIVAKDEQLVDVRLRGEWTVGRYHVWGDPQSLPETDGAPYNYPFVHNSGNYAAHLLFSVPITGKDRRSHQKLVVRTELEKLELDQRQHHTEIKNMILGLLERANLKAEQVALSREALELAHKNYNEAVMKLDAGRSSIFEVTTLRERLHDAQLTQQSNEIAYLDMIANIELTAGLLTQKWMGSHGH